MLNSPNGSENAGNETILVWLNSLLTNDKRFFKKVLVNFAKFFMHSSKAFCQLIIVGLFVVEFLHSRAKMKL